MPLIPTTPQPPTWRHKIQRKQWRGKWYWYETKNGGHTWNFISTAKVMTLIDSRNGIVLD